MGAKSFQKIVDDFTDARRQGFLLAKEAKDKGERIVGMFCTYTPAEIMMAAGARAVIVCAFSDETIEEAEKMLPRNLCPLIKSSLGYALTDKCPYVYFADLLVGETTCDGKKKMYEILGEYKKMHVMQLPQRQEDEKSQQLWEEEILQLKNKLEKDWNLTISTDDINQAICEKNEERALLIEFYELSKSTPPPLTGYQQLQVLFGSQYILDLDKRKEQLRLLISTLKQSKSEVPVTAKRIIVTGCPLAGATEKVIKAIENAGAVVVAFETCIGIKNAKNLVEENTKTPIKAIAKRYLKIGCSVMTPDTYRFNTLKELIEDFQAEGVVEMTLQACHTYAIETSILRKKMKEWNVPFISVETDYSQSDTAQLNTRLAAFVEMIS